MRIFIMVMLHLCSFPREIIKIMESLHICKLIIVLFMIWYIKKLKQLVVIHKW